jgi:hypothetical protein
MAGTSGNYYQISLTSGIDLNASEILRFDVTDGVYSSATDHTVTTDAVGGGGLFDFNLTLGPIPGDVYNDGHLVADVSRDDTVTSLDALMILQAVDQEG